jgi:predicted amidohydrolase
MKISIIQSSPVFGDIETNLEAIEQCCSKIDSDLVVLPELCTTGYQFKDRAELAELAEPDNGPTIKRFTNLAKSSQTGFVIGFAEKNKDKLFNSAALVGPQGLIGLYRKVHLFYDEKRLFDAGDLGFPVYQFNGVSVGMMVCFDWLFPESARSLALAGAAIIAHSANLVLPYCQAAMITRALENRVFTITANRIGKEHRIPDTPLEFTGASRIVAPNGQVLADGSKDMAEVISIEIDPKLADNKNITEVNHIFNDRRSDQYQM